MAVIIKNRQVETNQWQLLKAGADKILPAVPASGLARVVITFPPKTCQTVGWDSTVALDSGQQEMTNKFRCSLFSRLWEGR